MTWINLARTNVKVEHFVCKTKLDNQHQDQACEEKNSMRVVLRRVGLGSGCARMRIRSARFGWGKIRLDGHSRRDQKIGADLPTLGSLVVSW